MYSNKVQNELLGLFKKNNDILNGLLITGKWGVGKSYVVDELIKKNEMILKVDTWLCEGMPVEQMILHSILINKAKSCEELANEELEKLKYYSSTVAKEFLKEFSSSYVRSKAIKLFGEDGAKSLKNTIENIRKNKSYATDLNKYYKSLYDVPISRVCINNGIKYIIFDELDRTSPETMFEVLKYFKYSSKEDVKYSVCMNKVEAISILKHIYGESYSAEAYFDKLFKNEYKIEITKREKANYLFSSCIKFNAFPNVELMDTVGDKSNLYLIYNLSRHNTKGKEYMTSFLSELIDFIEEDDDVESTDIYLEQQINSFIADNSVAADEQPKVQELCSKLYEDMNGYKEYYSISSYCDIIYSSNEKIENAYILIDIVINMFYQDEWKDESSLRYSFIYELNLREIEYFVKEVIETRLTFYTKSECEQIAQLIYLKVKKPILFELIFDVKNESEYEKIINENGLKLFSYKTHMDIKFYPQN